jgi:hypothetical protein
LRIEHAEFWSIVEDDSRNGVRRIDFDGAFLVGLQSKRVIHILTEEVFATFKSSAVSTVVFSAAILINIEFVCLYCIKAASRWQNVGPEVGDAGLVITSVFTVGICVEEASISVLSLAIQTLCGSPGIVSATLRQNGAQEHRSYQHESHHLLFHFNFFVYFLDGR